MQALRCCFLGISIHALREEGDRSPRSNGPPSAKFLSTPSARRATDRGSCVQIQQEISIHALREEGDIASMKKASKIWNFYPRPPRGGRLGTTASAELLRRFLSTPSARRATKSGF